jgi:hypothetical protein
MHRCHCHHCCVSERGTADDAKAPLSASLPLLSLPSREQAGMANNAKAPLSMPLLPLSSLSACEQAGEMVGDKTTTEIVHR